MKYKISSGSPSRAKVSSVERRSPQSWRGWPACGCGRKTQLLRSLPCRSALTKGWTKTHIFLFSLAGEGRQMMLCLEFQEYFSHDFCPLVPGTLLISEATEIGLAFFPPAQLFPMCCAELRLPLLGAEGQLQVLYFSSTPLQSGQIPKLPLPRWAGSRASRIPVLVVLSSVHRQSVPLHWGAVPCCVWSPGVTASSSAWCCRAAPCSRAALRPVPAALLVLTAMAMPATQRGEAGARCYR